MKIKRNLYVAALLLGLTTTAYSQHASAAYTSNDSILACKIIQSDLQSPADAGKTLKGLPYVAHTLEGNKQEKLIINLRELDCTTFVENCIALYKSKGKDFNYYLQELQSLRYFNGVINGYSSRKHYMTSWINDNVSNGLITDLTQKDGTASLKTNLQFMSAHSYKYEYLMENKDSIPHIRQVEKKYSNITIKYLPKEELIPGGLPWIKDGDIIAILTTIKGLDVSHVGIAVYVNGELHLLHASSAAKKVIVDSRPLSVQINKPNCQGIRVLRVN